jgi:hypothetical protein
VKKEAGKLNYKSEIDISRYGIDTENSKMTYTVSQISAYEGQQSAVLGQYPGNKIQIDIQTEPRDIILLEVKQSSSHLI